MARESASEKAKVEPPPVRHRSAAAEVAAMIGLPPTSPPSVAPPAAGPPAVPAAAAKTIPSGFTPFELPEVIAGETYLSSLMRSTWGRATVLGLSVLLGVAGVLAIWTVVSAGNGRRDPQRMVAPSPPLLRAIRARRRLPRSVRFVDGGCRSRPGCWSTCGCRTGKFARHGYARTAGTLVAALEPSLLAELNLGPSRSAT